MSAKIIAKITNTVNFEEDTAIECIICFYLTKPITLENPSTALDIRVAASIRTSSSLKIFLLELQGK